MKELAAIQQELNCPKNQRNNFGNYNYRSCEDILEAVKPLLKAHGCTLTLTDQIAELPNVPVMVITDESTKPKTKTLTHGTIPYVISTAIIKNEDGSQEAATGQAAIDLNAAGKDYAQSFGASSSYARKYALNGLFLIDDTKDADATNKHGKEEKVEVLKFTDYKKEMEKAKDITEVKNIARKYSKAVENDWMKDEVEEAGRLYHARSADFAGE